MKHRICLIGNINPHYRFAIYRLMDEELNCSFYFGDHVSSPIKTFDANKLNGFKGFLRNVYFHKFYWQKSSVKLVLKDYDVYIMGGEPYCLSSWVILIMAKLMHKKTIAWTHGWYGRETKAKRIIKKLFYSLFTKLLIYNEYAIRLMEQEGFPKNKMLCIANSLDSDYDRKIRMQLIPTTIYSDHFHNNHRTIIYCGRIQKSKRLDLIIDALSLLKKQGEIINVVLVGKDSENVNISHYAEEKGIQNQVWMYGPCYDDKVLGELFFNAAACVSPGNVGLTAIHSLSFGCPVITHDDFPYQGPEFEAIKPGITGSFFHRGSDADLAKQILYWTSMNHYQRESTRMAAYNEIDRKWNIHYQINIIKSLFD